MKNPERFLTSPFFSLLVNTVPFRYSTWFMRTTILPLLLPHKKMIQLRLSIHTLFEKYFSEKDLNRVEAKTDEFIRHYRQKCDEDLSLINLRSRQILRLINNAVDCEGFQNFRKALELKRGILAVGAHFGSIILGTSALMACFRRIPREQRRRIRVRSEPSLQRFPLIHTTMREVAAMHNADLAVIRTERPRRDTRREIITGLSGQHFITTNLDVVQGGTSSKTFSFSDELSIPLPALVGASRCALESKAVVLPWHILRSPTGTFQLKIDEPVDTALVLQNRMNYDASTDFLSNRLFSIFCTWLNDAPEQWVYWDRFQKRVKR